MDSESPPPKRRAPAPSNHHIPPQILEEILLNLPVKSLLRFRCVSKSWKSKISESSFIREHRSRTTTLLHKRLFMISYQPTLLRNMPFRPFFQLHIRTATFSSTNIYTHPIDNAVKNPISPYVKLKAFCDELWCVEDGFVANGEFSMYLWNPFMRTYKKLPHPMHVLPSSSSRLTYLPLCSMVATYGMGYDAVNDDYKLLKVWKYYNLCHGTSLYSLRSDSWRETRQYFPGNYIPHSNGVFVNGAFHWMVLGHGQKPSAIISFDLSTESYKEVPQPMYSPVPNSMYGVEVTVLREMLCVWLNYTNDDASDVFVLWAMKDYGVEKSWSKIYDIRYDSIPLIEQKIKIGRSITLKPLHVYENGKILLWVDNGDKGGEIVIYKDEQVIGRQEVAYVSPRNTNFSNEFVCVESLISPATWPLIGSTNEA